MTTQIEFSPTFKRNMPLLALALPMLSCRVAGDPSKPQSSSSVGSSNASASTVEVSG